MNNPYTNKFLKYKLKNKDIKQIDNVWNFLNIFRITQTTRKKYRDCIIDNIRKNYDIVNFYKYEKILEKMYWNLVYKIKKDNDIKPKIYIKNISNESIHDLRDKIMIKNKYSKESNVRKSFVISRNKNYLYKYNYPNDLDLMASSIMINRSIYETYLSNDISIYDLNIEPYNNIIEFDYPFPNLNTIKNFSFDNKKERLNNIQKMYFDDDSYKNWF